ncbi:MAG: alpha-1,4-glucan--maltose-1-phosphate maltosyltransferase, partial [Acidimicrobiales bacterium]
ISPALQRNEGVFFHSVDNEHLIAWSKLSRGGDGILGVVNLDWRFPQSGFVDVDVEAIGLAGAERFAVRDVLSGERYIWSAGRNFVKLDPAVLSAHLFLLEGEP